MFSQLFAKARRNPFIILWVTLSVIQITMIFLNQPSVQVLPGEQKISVTYLLYGLLSWFAWNIKLIIPTLILSLLPTYLFSGLFISVIGSGQLTVGVMPLAAAIMKVPIQMNDWFPFIIYVLYCVMLAVLQVALLLLVGRLKDTYKYRLQYNHTQSFYVSWWLSLKEVVFSKWKMLVLIYVVLLILKTLTLSL
ncbi:hypothetical protein [Lentilactobacillus hilgardii]|uniref:hypothetical protein n=1 Tax=Lentilactobacillus hilgardii TaxID=1588 RepID=UPI0021C37C89|nr:hypothetical protein [Lentilactobacillus hilgardii]MCP9333400.1 hypothetical protein [Lentilactobacillus hilgardii]MCP9349324.1 hypothetical protein [Lentilactobacillus hilgardii]MCP9352192.1 hypothetical protein [Lentilactobacillus hilgardii]